MEIDSSRKKKGTETKPKKLGRPRTAPEGYRPFRQARMFAQRQELNNEKQWHDYARTAKCPKDIPSYPDRVYGKELWKGWADWLGVGILPYEQAKLLVHPHKIESPAQYQERFSELFPRPRIVSRDPDQYYTDWKGWSDYLGVAVLKRAYRPYQSPPTNGGKWYRNYRPPVAKVPKRRVYRPFMDAVKFVSGLGLRDRSEWLRWRGKYQWQDLPWKPEEVYGSEWLGWSIFLGHDPLPGLLTSVGVLYVGHYPTDPENVYRVEIHNLGKTDLLQCAGREGMRVVRMWKYEPEVREEVREALARNTSSWYGSDKMFVVQNIFGLYADLFNLLQVVQ